MFLNRFLLGRWNVGIIEDKAENILSSPENINIRWLKHRYYDRFFADPFLLKYDDKNYYILVEEFPFATNKGYISLLTVDRNSMKLVRKKKLIEEDYHLSYPFVLEDRIIPEAFHSGQCCSYKITEINKKKEKYANFGLIDQTILQYNGKEWIFATDKDNRLCGLKIFWRKNENDSWHPHSMNPVKCDIKTSRPGGHFFRIGDALYRPVQDSEKIYGHMIRIMKLNKLTEEDFEETEICKISSQESPPYNQGFHTFNVEDDFVVVDGYREYHSFVVKPLSVKCPKILKMFGEH